MLDIRECLAALIEVWVRGELFRTRELITKHYIFTLPENNQLTTKSEQLHLTLELLG